MAEVSCPKCGHPNAADQSFCGRCGDRLERGCGRCGAPNPRGHRFCGRCGAPLQSPAAAGAEERRWATVVFADLSGFTGLSEGLDPEEVREVADRCATKLGEIVSRYGGWLNRVIGDAVLAVFGAPVAHEDHAERAVRAALEMRECALENAAAFGNLTLSIGVNTGEVMVAPVGPEGARDLTVMGDVVNTAARLQSHAPSGGILVGLPTYETTREAIRYTEVEPFEAKGKAQLVRAWEPIEPLGGPAERTISKAPLVGRARELTLLGQTWDRVVAEQRPHLVTVLGPPGIGKSRLTREFLADLPDARVARGRCVPYGEVTGYSAFSQQIKDLAEIFESDPAAMAAAKVERLAHRLLNAAESADVARQLKLILGLDSGPASDRQMLFFGARRFVEAAAREHPTIFVFEDIHWADNSLLELIEMLASRTRDAPALFLTLSRPDLLNARPSWGGGLASYTALPLDRLSERDGRALVQHLLEHSEATSLARDLSDRAGGNPLFIEELAASVVERAGAAADSLPTHVQGIIAARLDSLPVHARAALMDASVVGRIFWRGALEQMGGSEQLDDALDVLEDRDFIRRESPSSIKGDTEFAFKHILIREVAYATLPKASRRERHASVANYMEAVSTSQGAEDASLLAHHWKEAADIDKATAYLLLAADRAAKTWAKKEAIELLDQALELITETNRHHTVRLQKAKLLLEAMNFAAAISLVDELLPHLDGAGLAEALFIKGRSLFWLVDVEGVKEAARELDTLARHDADFTGPALHLHQLAAGMDGRTSECIDTGLRAMEVWPKERFEPELALAVSLTGVNLAWVGRFEEAERLSREAYESGVKLQIVEAVLNAGGQMAIALTGQGRHEEAIEFARDVLGRWRDLEAAPRLTARALNMLAGTFREMFLVERSRELNEEAIELGRVAQFQNAVAQGMVDLRFADLLEGEPGRVAAGLAEAEDAAAKLKGWHEWLVGCRIADLRAWVALETATPDVAAELAGASVDYATKYGRRKYQARSRIALAIALGGSGRDADAVETAHLAAAEARSLGHPPTLWQAEHALSQLLYKTGKDPDAESAWERARDVIESFAATLTEEHRNAFEDANEVRVICGARRRRDG